MAYSLRPKGAEAKMETEGILGNDPVRAAFKAKNAAEKDVIIDISSSIVIIKAMPPSPPLLSSQKLPKVTWPARQTSRWQRR